jgi:hypothetical protein
VNRTPTVLLSIVLLVFVSAPFTQATQILHQTPQQLGEQSELVVHGRVMTVESAWNDKRTKVFTTTVISVENTYKGAAAPVVEIVQLGGVVDNIRVNVSGSLQWRPGEVVLLFLAPYEGRYAVSGFSQGKFNVKRDAKTGEAYIERPELEGVEIMGAPSKDGAAKPTKVESVPLEAFVDYALGTGNKGGAK